MTSSGRDQSGHTCAPRRCLKATALFHLLRHAKREQVREFHRPTLQTKADTFGLFLPAAILLVKSSIDVPPGASFHDFPRDKTLTPSGQRLSPCKSMALYANAKVNRRADGERVGHVDRADDDVHRNDVGVICMRMRRVSRMATTRVLRPSTLVSTWANRKCQ